MSRFNSILNLSPKKVLVLIFIIAVAVRVIYFRDSLTFFYDQARDAFAAMDVWQGDPIKVLGPQTDFPGLHHGSLYWYLLSPFYFLSGGSVWVVRAFLILLNSLAVFFIYDLTRSLFGNKKVALFAALFFALSFEAVQYARWLSNPAPAVFSVAATFWALDRLLKGKKWALAILLVSWGASMQFQIFMVYQFLVFLIIWISQKGFSLPKVSGKVLLISSSLFLISVATYILAEVKFNFQGLKTLVSFLLTQSRHGESFIGLFQSYLDSVVNVFSLNLWGINLFLAGTITVATLIATVTYIRKGKNKNALLFLLFWMLSPILINLFTGPRANFISLGTLIPAVILTAYFMGELKGGLRPLFYLGLATIILSNLNLIITKNREGETLFTVQKQMILGDELKVIDWVYNEAGGKPFRLNTITNPLFINATWAYLFNWYGRMRYGYMPFWWGETQVDVPGSKVKFSDNKSTDLEFLIIEPASSSNDYYPKAIEYLENTRSQVIKSQKFGYFNVEKRTITRERIFTAQDAFFVIQNNKF